MRGKEGGGGGQCAADALPSSRVRHRLGRKGIRRRRQWLPARMGKREEEEAVGYTIPTRQEGLATMVRTWYMQRSKPSGAHSAASVYQYHSTAGKLFEIGLSTKPSFVLTPCAAAPLTTHPHSHSQQWGQRKGSLSCAERDL